MKFPARMSIEGWHASRLVRWINRARRVLRWLKREGD